jgi:tetratricopeptide (TPR) repeat protein
MPLQTWRILLPRLAELPNDLDEELFQALLALEQKQLEQDFRWDEASSWSINQSDGSLRLFFDDDTEVKARIQIIGTFNGDTFIWAWANPSIREELRSDSLRLKAHGIEQGWSVFDEPSFAAAPRDGYAFAALAAGLFDCQGAYAGASGGTVIYLTLRDLVAVEEEVRDEPEFAPPSLLKDLTGLLAAQTASVQLSLSDLREVENICRRAHVQSSFGDHLSAAGSLEEAWQSLGAYAGDQEPAGFIKLAMGNELFLAGKMEEALSILNEADELPGCPDLSLLYQRMGQCYAALGKKKRAIDMFARVYVASGSHGLAQMSPADRDLFCEDLKKRRQKAAKAITARLNVLGEDKEIEEAAATVACLVQELNAFETHAHKEQEKARKCEEMAIQLCDQDMGAQEKINTWWTWLMAVWCTPLRSPRCSSIQFPPAHDPERENLLRVWRTAEGRLAVETASEDAFGSINKWRYELENLNGSLLVSQIYSVWDDEEFSCI